MLSSFTQAHLCDKMLQQIAEELCNTPQDSRTGMEESCDTTASSIDMKSIAAGPLRPSLQGMPPSPSVEKVPRRTKTSQTRSRTPGKRKENKPKLLGPDILGWCGGLPREGVGAKKFGMSVETQENQTFWRDIPGFWPDIPGHPKSLRKKCLCSILVP